MCNCVGGFEHHGFIKLYHLSTTSGHQVRWTSCYTRASSLEKHGADLFEANTQIGGEQNWDYLPYGPFSKLAEYDNGLKTIEAEADP